MISMYQKNSLGAKSIATFQSLYNRFGQPILPYLQTPYSIISPYLAKADTFGDSSLKAVDDRFPALKSTNFEKLKGTASDYAHYPFQLAGDGKGYVTKTYDEEYSRAGGQGLGTTGKAMVSTQVHITSDFLEAVSSYLRPKKDELQAEFEKTKKAGSEKVQKTKKMAQEKQDDLLHKQPQMVNSH